MGDFIAVDVETANADISSICSFGLVHFRDGVVYRNLSTLVNPEDDFEPVNISVHRIKAEDVVGAPTIKELYPVFLKHFGEGVTLVHHTHFDRSAFRKVAEKLGMPELACRWLDSARVTRHAWPQYSKKGYGLADVCYDFKIDFKHHDAAEDARACGLLLCKAMQDHDLTLDDWLKRADTPIGGSVDAAPREINFEGPLYGHVVVFTGTLSIPRSTAEKMAMDAGCKVASSVSKKTSLVVAGEQDIRVLNGHTRSAKHREVEDLIRSGHPIQIVGENDFRLLIGSSLSISERKHDARRSPHV